MADEQPTSDDDDEDKRELAPLYQLHLGHSFSTAPGF